jgi:hypothetical protein
MSHEAEAEPAYRQGPSPAFSSEMSLRPLCKA